MTDSHSYLFCSFLCHIWEGRALLCLCFTRTPCALRCTQIINIGLCISACKSTALYEYRSTSSQLVLFDFVILRSVSVSSSQSSRNTMTFCVPFPSKLQVFFLHDPFEVDTLCCFLQTHNSLTLNEIVTCLYELSFMFDDYDFLQNLSTNLRTVWCLADKNNHHHK